MRTLKKIAKALLFPHTGVLICLVILSAVMLIYSFVVVGTEGIISYVTYTLSAYTLTAACCKTPDIIRLIKRIKQENRYIVRLSSDAHLRVKLSLYGSLAINTAYAVFQLGLGLFHGSVWFYSLAAYYTLLVIMRFFLLKDVRGRNAGENLRLDLKRYRFCGVILALMNVALISIVFFIAYFNRGFTHHPITTIAMAAYTFSAFTIAILNVIKYRKYQSPVYSASKVINLAAASVSMLTLETAMLSAFGDGSEEQMRGLLTTMTGAAVCVFILCMAIYMIVHANKELKKIN